MDAPPPQEDLGRFLRTARDFRGRGLRVPVVFAADEAAGFALVEDLGQVTYLEALARDPGQAVALYDAAIDALVDMQLSSPASGDDAQTFPPYDEALLRRELDVFRTWYLQRHLRLAPASHAALLEEAFDALVGAALAQPRVLVHRDYHSRNLMASSPPPGILDFQDAVIGPLAYDLASLLRDCYVDVPAPLEARCVARFADRWRQRAGQSAPGLESIGELMDWVAVQRHLKVLGIFVRLWYRDGRPDYLQYLPRVRAYLHTACARLPALAKLGGLLNQLAPADERAVEAITVEVAANAAGQGDTPGAAAREEER